MTLQAAAFGLYVLTFAMLGAASVLSQWLFFRKHTVDSAGVLPSDDQLTDQFFQNPFRLVTRGPPVVADRIDALFTPVQDHELERMRRRTLVLFGATAAWLVVGAPTTFLLATLAARVGLSVGPLPGLVILLAWIGNLAWGIRRQGVGAAFVIAAMGGAYVGSLLMIGALAR